MPFKSRAQVEKLRALEKTGAVPAGTVARWLAETPRPERLPKRLGGRPARVRRSNRAPPRPSITRENRGRGR